ncbi:MAG: hypothetical protein Q9202_002280 [Teloschistes flavicans]
MLPQLSSWLVYLFYIQLGTGLVLHRNPEISEAGDIGQSGNGNSMSADGPKVIGVLHHKDARSWNEIDRKDLPAKIASPELVPIVPPLGDDQPTNEYGGTYLEGANAPTAYKLGDHFRIPEGESH